MTTWNHQSPLVEAVEQRDRHKLRATIQRMSAEEFQQHAYSGLLRACTAGLAGLARILLEAGANPNEHQIVWYDPLEDVVLYPAAFEFGCHSGKGIRQIPDGFPLEQAAKKTPELVSLLLKHGADPNSVGAFGYTALMQAAYASTSRKAALLLQAGADVNAVESGGISALQSAAAWGKCQTLELLLRHGALINHQDSYGNTALTNAARKGNAAHLHTLLKHGADHTLRNRRGYNALEIAIRLGRHHAVRVLLKEGLSATEKDPRGRSPLFHALCRRRATRHKERRAQVVRLLLTHGADATEPIRYGVTPLHLAAWRGWTDVLAVMLEFTRHPGIRDAHGRTARDYAARRGHLQAARLLADAEERMRG